MEDQHIEDNEIEYNEIEEVPILAKRCKTKNPKYFVDYYHENLSKKVNCDVCNKLLSKAKVKRHQASKACKIK
jgi:hypothetical protein